MGKYNRRNRVHSFLDWIVLSFIITIIAMPTGVVAQAESVYVNERRFKQTMESYEAFCDEYVDFQKNGDISDPKYEETSMLLKIQYYENMRSMSQFDDIELPEADKEYYLEVRDRILQKLDIQEIPTATSMLRDTLEPCDAYVDEYVEFLKNYDLTEDHTEEQQELLKSMINRMNKALDFLSNLSEAIGSHSDGGNYHAYLIDGLSDDDMSYCLDVFNRYLNEAFRAEAIYLNHVPI